MNEPQPDPAEVIQLTADTLGRDVLNALLDEIKPHVGWIHSSQDVQNQIIQRLQQRVRLVITEGLNVLFRGHYPAIPAMLDSITIKNGITAKIIVPKGAKNWHELADAQGSNILLIIADPEQYAQRMDEIKAAADQGDLFPDVEDRNYKPSETYRRDEPAQTIDKSWQDLIDDVNRTNEGPPQEGELTFGSASEQPREKVATMAEQVVEKLAQVHVSITLDTAQKFTEQECVVAYYWASEFLKNAETAPPRPFWLPLQDPPRAEDIPAHLPGADDSHDDQTEGEIEDETDSAES